MTGVADKDRLVIIARAYYYLKGDFTSHDLYNFIQKNNFGFRCVPSVRVIGAILSRSSLFNSTKHNKNNMKVFEVI